MSCESYIKQLLKFDDWEATTSVLDINVEFNCIQVQYPNSISINPKIDKKALFPKALY